MQPEPFLDRADAGRRLAAAVKQLLGDDPAVVLALPRGGVTVAAEVARVLHAPLDVLVVRKIGVPGHRELAMGALAAGTVVRNAEVIDALGIDERAFARVVDEETAVAQARERAYRGVRQAVDLAGRAAVVVDDGLATGATARAALQALRDRDLDRPSRVVLAVPVAPPDTLHRLAALVDDTVCLLTPDPFYAVGEWYRHFDQVSDDEVTALLTGADTVHGDA